MEVDGTKKGKEFDSVLGKLGEILVYHLQGALKDVLHDIRNLILHEGLQKSVRILHKHIVGGVKG